MPRVSDIGAVVVACSAAVVLLAAAGGCGREHPAEAPESEASPREPDLLPGRSQPKPRVAIETDFGRMVLELFPREAPAHVDQFLDLVAKGFYDGTTFHRVVPGFLIQGGDPNTKDDDPTNDGYGGLEDHRLALEISETLTFRRGTLGMARDYRPDGASCQFFITVGRASHLDGEYTIFGRAITGLDVLDAIDGVEVDEGRHPIEPVVIRAMRVVSDPRENVEPSRGDAPDDAALIDNDAIEGAPEDSSGGPERPDEAVDDEP